MTQSQPPSPPEALAGGAPDLLRSPSFSAGPWQMSFGERAAIEGVLAQLRPRLSIEIGTAEGGSLRRIAAFSARVISFDLVEPEREVRGLANVELRTGDSHELLPLELERLSEAGEEVDFVLVDGDHSAEGARTDVADLLASDVVSNTVILAHDSLNQEVRRGLDEVPYTEIEKVAFVDLDFVGGYVPAESPTKGECWGGLALIVVDESGAFGPAHDGRRPRMEPLSNFVWPGRDGGDDAIDYRSLAAEMEGSLSWRVTAPLRVASARLRGRR